MQSLNMTEPNKPLLFPNRPSEVTASAPDSVSSERSGSFESELQEARSETHPPESEDRLDPVEVEKKPDVDTIEEVKEEKPEEGAMDDAGRGSHGLQYVGHVLQPQKSESQVQNPSSPVENALPNGDSHWNPNLEGEGGLVEASVTGATTAPDAPEKRITAQGPTASPVLPRASDAAIIAEKLKTPALPLVSLEEPSLEESELLTVPVLEPSKEGLSEPSESSKVPLNVLPKRTEGANEAFPSPFSTNISTKSVSESPKNITLSDPLNRVDLAPNDRGVEADTPVIEQKMPLATSPAVRPGLPPESESTSILDAKAVLASASPDGQSQSGQSQMSFDKGPGFSFSQGSAASSVPQSAVSQTASSFQARLDGMLQAPDEMQVLRQVATQLRSFRPGQNESLRFLLDPKELGRIQIDVVFHEEGVRAHFLTSDPAVKELLEGNQSYLKQSLADQGLEMASFSVDVGDMAQNEEQKAAFEGTFSGKPKPDSAQTQDEAESVSETLKARAARTRGKSQVSVYV